MSTLFASILKEATEAARDENSKLNKVEGFRPRSDLHQPTDGFTLPPTADGKVAYGYQAAAVQTVKLFRRVVLGFSPGMGKTLVAIAAAVDHIRTDGGRVLVVCPPSLRLDPWEREISKQFPGTRITSLTNSKQADIPSADVLLVPDSVTLTRRLDDILAWAPTGLVVDEVQRFKSPAAQRTKTLHVLADTIPDTGIVVAMSGTLAKNTPDDVWSPFRTLGLRNVNALSGGPSFTAFQQRWCYTEPIRVAGGRTVLVTTGAKNGLHEALRTNAYVRVERADVLDMPEKIWIDRGLALSASAQKKYDRIEADFIRWIAETKGDAAALRASKAEAITKLMALWETAGILKADGVAEYIQSLTDQGEKVVVMARHKSVVAALKQLLEAQGIKVSLCVGGMSAKQKLEDQDRFKSVTGGGTQVLIANIESGGTGLNLEVSAHLVFAQTDFSPGNITQASDRIFRVTQKRDCTIHVPNAAGTVDEHVWSVLQAKAGVVDDINSGGADVSIDLAGVQDAVLESYGWESSRY